MEAKEKKQPDASSSEAKGQKAKRERPAVLPYMQNRELSWLTFNKRVLDQGEDRNVPLLERVTFVSIFSSNLQEFFMVRVGSLTDLSLVKKELRDNKTQMTPDEQLLAIYERCHDLYPEQERIFKQLQGQLAEYGIRQLLPGELSDEQSEYLHDYLEAKVVPYLSPQIINSRHPFPHLENGALYVLLRLDEEQGPKDGEKGDKKKGKNLGAEDATFGLIPLPRQAKRVIELPGEGTQFILLENALKTIVDEVFSMYTTKRASVICVTRNADIDPNDGTEDDIDYDYREHMKRILKKRGRLAPVRLESDTPLSAVTEKFLLKRLNLKPYQVYITSVPLDMSYAWGLAGMVDPELAPQITNEPFSPSWPACLDKRRPIMEQVCERDVILSYPYESMDPFVNLLREAANDPSVISIKITLYRLASQSHLAEALLNAAENGKEVTALFELRARFDESNNIEWSQRFEEAGANVIYGFHDFKVHSKICAITRHTDKGLQHITQLGTGNYNEKTSKLYTDFSFITADEGIGKDAAEFFRNMSLENASDSYQKLSVAPLQIKPMILRKIDEQIALAREGKPCGLLFKTNSVTDKDIIVKIAEASQAGIKTTLFVRGISCIVPGIEGYTDNVEVVSIVGRLLEHSRIYAFGERENREMFLSSADLMTRNMEKRVEIAWPLTDPSIKQQVNDYLDICLSDTAKLRMIKPDLDFTPLEFFSATGTDGALESFDAQAYLIKKARADYELSITQREEEAAQRSATARAQRVRDRDVLAAAKQAAEEEAARAAADAEAAAAAAAKAAEAAAASAAQVAAETSGQATAEAPAPVAEDAAPVVEVAAPAEDAAPAETPAPVAEVAEVPAEPAASTPAAAPAETPAAAPEAQAEQPASDAPEPAGFDDRVGGGMMADDEPEPIEHTPGTTSARKSHAGFDDLVAPGIVETEPGVAGPTAAPEPAPSAEAAVPTPKAEVLPPLEEQSAAPEAIQLVPKKPSLWARIKFLFTGKL